MLLLSQEKHVKQISSGCMNHRNLEIILAGIAFKLENVGPIFSSFNACPSSASVETDDRKQFRGEGGGGGQLMQRQVLPFKKDSK